MNDTEIQRIIDLLRSAVEIEDWTLVQESIILLSSFALNEDIDIFADNIDDY